MVRSVTSAVEIPVMVRLPHHAALNLPLPVRSPRTAPVPSVPLNRWRASTAWILKTPAAKWRPSAGCTGSHLRPLSLAATAVLHQLADCEIAAMCGVEDCTASSSS